MAKKNEKKSVSNDKKTTDEVEQSCKKVKKSIFDISIRGKKKKDGGLDVSQRKKKHKKKDEDHKKRDEEHRKKDEPSTEYKRKDETSQEGKKKDETNEVSQSCKSKRKKKHKSREEVTKEANTIQQTILQPAAAPQGAVVVQKWVQRALDMGVEQLRNEFRGLAKYTLPEMTTEAFMANQPAGRNRYLDVPCQDQCRVVIKWPGAQCDYVHANYVGTPISAKRFICTQGPLDPTVNDFWTMVIQEEAETIVMLCNCIETGKNKCSPYWPSTVGETRKYEGCTFEITNKEMRPMSPEEQTVIVSILNIKFNKANGGTENRELRHYQWQDWPDRGVPPCKLTSMELLSRVRGTSKPIIVHCSAGIGRTGTIVAIEYILERMQARVECATMGDLLKELRNQRAYTIQNDLQYLYIHRVMLCYFLEKHRARYESCLAGENGAKYKKFVEEYNAATNT